MWGTKISITTYLGKEERPSGKKTPLTFRHMMEERGTTQWENKTPHQCGGHNVMVVFRLPQTA